MTPDLVLASFPSLLGFQEVVLQAPANPIVQSLGSIPWFGWIAIVAIVSGCISGVVAQCHRHRERMEMIRHGMHPDLPPTEEEAASFKSAHPEL